MPVSSVSSQVRGGTYNLASNLALLRLYIFYPESTNIKVVSNILVKACLRPRPLRRNGRSLSPHQRQPTPTHGVSRLSPERAQALTSTHANLIPQALMALPEGDFALCMDLIPQKTQSDATITALSTLASHLEVRCGARCSPSRCAEPPRGARAAPEAAAGRALRRAPGARDRRLSAMHRHKQASLVPPRSASSSSHPQLAKFKDFWAAAEPLSDLLGAVPGFADAARAYICALHGDVYRRCPKAVLREALNLPQAEFDALVQKRCAGANAWKLAGENIEFPFEEAAQQQQPSAAAEVIPLGKVEALFSKQAVAAA